MIKANIFNFTSTQFVRIKKNFISLLSNFTSKIFLQIFFPSLMIIVWGVESFGIWIFVTALPSTFTFLNLHFSYAARIEMTMNYAKKNFKLLNLNFQNGFGLVIMNMVIYTILCLSFFLISDLKLEIFKNININEIKIVLLLILISFYFSIFDSILSTGICYWGKINIPTHIKTIADLCLKILIILSGLFFDSLIYPAIIYFVVSIIRTSVLYYYFLVNKKNVELSVKLINKKTSFKLFKLSLSFYAETISAIVKHNLFVVILGIFYSAEIVGLISTSKTLFYFLPIAFVGIFNHVGIYEYSEAIGRKASSLIKKNYFRHIFLILVLFIIFTLFSLTIGGKIYNLWTNYVYDFNFVLLILIVSNAVFYLLQSTISSILKSANNFFKPVLYETILSIIALIISYFCLRNGYDYIYILKIFLMASLTSLIIYSYYSFKFYNNIIRK